MHDASKARQHASTKVRYTHHLRKPAGSPEGGRFAPGKAVKIMPVLTKPRTVVVPGRGKRTGRK
jgi:hypothetical protein